MKKHVFGRHLRRDKNERKALFTGLMSSLVEHERIETTEYKAKAVKPQFEKLITLSRNEKKTAYALLQPYLYPPAVKKMIEELGPRFAKRPGGYTRIIKLGNRFNDNASMVYLELVEKKAVRADGEFKSLPAGKKVAKEVAHEHVSATSEVEKAKDKKDAKAKAPKKVAAKPKTKKEKAK